MKTHREKKDMLATGKGFKALKSEAAETDEAIEAEELADEVVEGEDEVIGLVELPADTVIDEENKEADAL